MNVLEGLNEEQIQAVTTTEGYIRVIAGAGTGKTRALTHRYAFLTNEFGISTANLLCVTFTNKAAAEMRQRIRAMIGDKDTGTICTFHGLAVRILREDIHEINFPPNFMVMDEEDQNAILRTVYEESGIKAKSFTFKKAKEMIGRFKYTFKQLPCFIELDTENLRKQYEAEEDISQKILLGYLYEQKKIYALDYDDLIAITLYILRNNAELRLKWQQRMMYIMVDEFQDVDVLNMELAETLSGYHHNLFIVGDPDQTIYSWRGANVNFILDFDRRHPEAQTLYLKQNYRSTPEIVAVANSLIEKNRQHLPNPLEANRANGEIPLFSHRRTAKDEAEFILKTIQNLVQQGHPYQDIAILYRAHHVSRDVEDLFIAQKIPYVLFSGVEFYQRKEIKDAVSYLRMVLYGDDLAFQRIVNEPPRNIGKKKMQILTEYAESHHCSLYNALNALVDDESMRRTQAQAFIDTIEKYRKLLYEMRVSDLFSALLNDSGYEAALRESGDTERLDHLQELKESIYDFERTAGEETTLEEYLQNVALYTNNEAPAKKDAVSMMTVHSAKGLEFPVVLLIGMNEGTFPSSRTETPEELEEERRVAYVAYTRARDQLILTDAEGSSTATFTRYPSRFIFNVDKNLLRYEPELNERFLQLAEQSIRESEERLLILSNLFHTGDRVQHKFFGLGTVLEVNNRNSAYTVKFDTIATERSISFTAPLTRAVQNA